MKKGFKAKILPLFHPESIRVRLIAKDIIDALKRGLQKEQRWSDLEYASESSSAHPDRGFETYAALTGESEDKIEGTDSWRKEEELLHDSWVKESMKSSARGAAPAMQHLEGLNWEFLVVNKPIVNAFCCLLVLYQFITSDMVYAMSTLLLRFPFSRRYIPFYGLNL
ncbi:hypothetical protein RJ641_033392 [Dillenia turbinata]|uniref:Uncharacterized protein n=1 Tax=Dillenia turbinata TaxID=194707 RepID=A0AAN8ZG08_9MAGN